jgi:hypothetical protein
MPASSTVKLSRGRSVKDLFESEVQKHFNRRGDDTRGQLTLKMDGSVKIGYTVQRDSVTLTVIESPKLFSDSDQKKMLNELFG